MNASAGSGRTRRFGPFEINLETGELNKHGRPVRLQEQPFQILAMLLQQPGETLTREQLREKLWRTDTFVDFDHGLNNAINRLREALGDSADTPRYIETLPRRGYRFVGAVDRPIAADLPVAASVIGSNRNIWISASAIVTVVVLILGFNIERRRVSAGSARAPIRSLAVIPLENLSGDPSQEYFADGMTDALTTDLAQIASLRVISRTSAMRYKGTRQPVAEIGRELHVDAVVEGSVVRAGNRVRVTAQLINATTDQHLWAEGYERDVRDVVALQGEVARTIAGNIRLELTSQEQARLGRLPSTNPTAYDYYLRGRFHMARVNVADVNASVEMFEQAVAADPGFALAYAELSRAYRRKGNGHEQQWDEKAFVALEHALKLDPDLPEGHLARARMLWTPSHGFPHRQVIEEYRRALAANPNLDEAHYELGHVYNHIGLLDNAFEELNRAVAINPANVLARLRIGINLLYQTRYEPALAVINQVPRETDVTIWDYQSTWALFHLGRTAEALAVAKQAFQDSERDDGGLLTSLEAMLVAQAGDARRAEDLIRIAAAKGKGYTHFHHTEYNIAAAYALMNKPGPALRWLKAAADDGFPCYPLFERDSSLDSLRRDPHFVEFMSALKRQWDEYKRPT